MYILPSRYQPFASKQLCKCCQCLRADKVYVRVDVYNPSLNRWRRAADMSDPRHGIFPVLSPANNLIYVIGGGEHSANAQTARATVFKGP